MLFKNINSNILKKKKSNGLMLSRNIRNSLYYENYIYIYGVALKYAKIADPI